MVRRLRALLEAPHDPAVAQAVVVLACVVTVCLLVVIGVGADSRSSGGSSAATPEAASLRPEGETATERRPAPTRRSEPVQDPQDRPGTAAARRARRELASHRALQHVPYRRGGVGITLIGVRGARAVLRVEALSVRAGHRAWWAFLRRYGDDGRSYLPVFRVRGGSRAVAVAVGVPVAVAVDRFRAQRRRIARHTAVSRLRLSPRSPRHLEVAP